MSEKIEVIRRQDSVLLRYGALTLKLDSIQAQRLAQAINVVVSDIDIPKTALIEAVEIDDDGPAEPR